MWVIVYGSVGEGFNFRGPFTKEEDAIAYAEAVGDPHETCELVAPADGTGSSRLKADHYHYMCEILEGYRLDTVLLEMAFHEQATGWSDNAALLRHFAGMVALHRQAKGGG